MEQMTEKEFVNNAIKLLTKDFSIPKEEAEAMAKLTVILERNDYGKRD